MKQNERVKNVKCHPNGITREDAAAQNNENLINRDFTVEGFNERWLYDIIEVPCRVADIAAVLEKSSGWRWTYSMHK